MAEILGIVASGLTVVEVAARLGAGAFTLKRAWAQVKGAPQTITALVDEIAMITPLLEQLEADTTSLARSGHTTLRDPSARQAVDFCRRALDEVSAITDDLVAQVNSAGKVRRGAAKVKIALKKDLLADYESRLRWVVTTLGLAQQYYLVTLVKRQPVLLADMLEERNIPPEPQEHNTRPRPSEPSSAILCNSGWQEEPRKPWFPRKRISPSIVGNFAIQSSCQPQDSGSKSAHCIQMRLPTWLSRKAWDVLVSKSYSGFDFTLRVYLIVPRRSPAFQFAYAGDLDGLQGLFESKQASPFDQLSDGRSLLYAATSSGRTDVMAFLLNCGVDLEELVDFDRTPTYSLWGTLSRRDNIKKLGALHQLLLSRNAYREIVNEWCGTEWEDSNSLPLLMNRLSQSLEAMRLILPFLGPGATELPIQERIDVFSLCLSTSGADNVDDADALHLLLYADRGLLASEVRHLHELGWGLYQRLAFFYSRITCYIYGESGSEAHHLWRTFTCDAVKLTMELYKDQHHLHDIPVQPSRRTFLATTPLFQVIRGVSESLLLFLEVYDITFRVWRRAAEKTLRIWLEDLRLSGVDLLEYGVQEAYMFTHDPRVGAQCYGPGWEEPREWVCDIEGFYYGSEPQDWHFTWDMGVEELAGDFWHSIEDPWLHIPGAWTDDWT